MSRETIASQAAKRAPTLSKPRHFASSPVSHGRGSNASFRILGMYPAPLGGCADITGLYTARYGMPPVGEQVFVRVNQFDDGWECLPVTFSAIVPDVS